jgi:site-specific recombinase XerD
MKRITDFAYYVTSYLSSYLPGQKNVSVNTIKSYRDTFRLFLLYCNNVQGIRTEKLELQTLTKDSLNGFLNWVEKERGCSITTRNQRLACIHSFIRYVQSDIPERLMEFQRILAIPTKKGTHKPIDYLTPSDLSVLLKQVLLILEFHLDSSLLETQNLH